MNITEENTVAEIVVQNIKSAHVFKKHGIDTANISTTDDYLADLHRLFQRRAHRRR